MSVWLELCRKGGRETGPPCVYSAWTNQSRGRLWWTRITCATSLLQASRSILIRISFLLNISVLLRGFLFLRLKIGRYWSGGIKLLSRFEFPARTGRTLLWRIVAQTVADNLLELLTIIHCQASWCDAFFSTMETASLFQESTRLGLFSGWVPIHGRQAGLTVDWLARQ